MQKILMVILAVTLLMTGCGRDGKKKKNDATAVKTEQAYVFPYVTVPPYLVDEAEKREYVLEHYWDKFDFSDEKAVDHQEEIEQAFVNFIAMIAASPDQKPAHEALRGMMVAAEKNPTLYDMFVEMTDRYLYDPNSPMLNEELYIVVLESQVNNPHLEDIYKVAPRERLRMANENRVGTKANDFVYNTSSGASGRLYGIKADYTIVFFYNLGCTACKEVRERMINVLATPHLEKMVAQGKLKVLALYPDSDMTEWYKYRDDIPAEWINGYDAKQAIRDNDLYDLRAIPTLYLLDKDKTVVLKDFLAPEILPEVIR